LATSGLEWIDLVSIGQFQAIQHVVQWKTEKMKDCANSSWMDNLPNLQFCVRIPSLRNLIFFISVKHDIAYEYLYLAITWPCFQISGIVTHSIEHYPMLAVMWIWTLISQYSSQKKIYVGRGVGPFSGFLHQENLIFKGAFFSINMQVLLIHLVANKF
jgi:hypothetical protein